MVFHVKHSIDKFLVGANSIFSKIPNNCLFVLYVVYNSGNIRLLGHRL